VFSWPCKPWSGTGAPFWPLYRRHDVHSQEVRRLCQAAGSIRPAHRRIQAIKHKLADIKIFIEAARSLCYRIAWCKDQGRPLNHLEAAVAKLFVGDWSLAPANDAVVLFGGYGYCHEYEVERYFRTAVLLPSEEEPRRSRKESFSKLMQWA